MVQITIVNNLVFTESLLLNLTLKLTLFWLIFDPSFCGSLSIKVVFSYRHGCILTCFPSSFYFQWQNNFVEYSSSRFTCRKCSKEFTSKNGLSRHMQLHTGQFKFFCEVCRKGYNNNTAYKSHMDKHDGVKYQCNMCSKSFCRKELLLDHKSIHTGVFRFQCDFCGKGFNTKAALKKHNASH